MLGLENRLDEQPISQNRIKLVEVFEVGYEGCSSEVNFLQARFFQELELSDDYLMSEEGNDLAKLFRGYICSNLCKNFDYCTNTYVKISNLFPRNHLNPDDLKIDSVTLTPQRIGGIQRVMMYKDLT